MGVTGPKWGPIASWTDSFSGYIPTIMKNQSVCGQLSQVKVKVFRIEMAVGFEISCGGECKQLGGDKRLIWLDGSGFPAPVCARGSSNDKKDSRDIFWVQSTSAPPKRNERLLCRK